MSAYKYREFAEDGTASGGPMYYMKNKLNMKYGVLFAVAAIINILRRVTCHKSTVLPHR